MKAIIPVAGAGTKLRPLTYTQPKALIPIAGKTILAVIIDQLLEAGVNDFVFVIGYLGEKIQRYIAHQYPQLKYNIVSQNDRRGTGHAIWLTKEAVGDDDELLIVLGDTICDYNVREFISSSNSLIGVRRVDDPRSFGVAELDENDQVVRVVEKPLIPRSNMAMVGLYYVKESKLLFETLESRLATHSGEQDEYHLTQALQDMIESGAKFKALRVANWFDCGKKETLLSTNAILLREMQENGSLQAYLAEGAVIIPPVSIAEGCSIAHSIIGPNVTIGEHTHIDASIIRDSIIGSYAELNEVVLHSSIIGSDANVRGMSQSLNIGDNTEIDLG
ncbi:MAG: NTP transferase domain-containing protein [Bacteroidetes bacterium]|nr:NTP transferase domain-containing protein [Bacteroidota bacterium]MBS1630154.1 NTP transferase domain-containing protein [Bacteroidota bacterium]